MHPMKSSFVFNMNKSVINSSYDTWLARIRYV